MGSRIDGYLPIRYCNLFAKSGTLARVPTPLHPLASPPSSITRISFAFPALCVNRHPWGVSHAHDVVGVRGISFLLTKLIVHLNLPIAESSRTQVVSHRPEETHTGRGERVQESDVFQHGCILSVFENSQRPSSVYTLCTFSGWSCKQSP